MAIVIEGKTTCPICKETIIHDQEVVSFPAFVWNKLDPLWMFNDAAFHKDCFYRHPLATQAQARFAEFEERTSRRNRRCLICGAHIINPNDYLELGYLVNDPRHPLYRFNYAYFHRSHLAGWAELPTLIHEIEVFDQSGSWEGDGLKRLLAELHKMF